MFLVTEYQSLSRHKKTVSVLGFDRPKMRLRRCSKNGGSGPANLHFTYAVWAEQYISPPSKQSGLNTTVIPCQGGHFPFLLQLMTKVRYFLTFPYSILHILVFLCTFLFFSRPMQPGYYYPDCGNTMTYAAAAMRLLI